MRKICLLLIIACVCSCSNERKNEKVDTEFKDRFTEQEKLKKEPVKVEVQPISERKQKISDREQYVNSLNYDDLDSLFLESKITVLEYSRRKSEQIREQEQRQLLKSDAIDIVKAREDRIKENLGTDPLSPD